MGRRVCGSPPPCRWGLSQDLVKPGEQGAHCSLQVEGHFWPQLVGEPVLYPHAGVWKVPEGAPLLHRLQEDDGSWGCLLLTRGGTFCFSLKEGSTVNMTSRCSLLLAVINVVSVGAQPAMKSEFPSAGLSPTSCVGGRGRVVRCLSAALPVTEVNHLGKSQPREHHFSWPEG